MLEQFEEHYDLSEDIAKCKYMAVYGTLRQGFGNNRLLGDSKFLATAKSDFWGTMYSNGGFPILSLDEPLSKIVVEIFEIPDEGTLDAVDGLEGYPYWYNRTIKTFNIDGELIQAWIYHQENITGLETVDSGDWKKFKEGNK